METNVGFRDRRFRMGLGAFLVVAGALGYSGMVPLANMLPQELTSVVLSVVGLVLILTAYFRKCLFYRLLGMDTSEDRS